MKSDMSLIALTQKAAQQTLYKRIYSLLPARWSDVPTISRDTLQRTSLVDRLEIDRSEVELFRVTSGTSGKGILIVPRALSEYDLTSPLQQEVYKERSVSRLATFSAGEPHFNDTYMQRLGIMTVLLDPGDLSVSKHVITLFKPDMLAGPAYALERLSALLSLEERSMIRAVQVFGEKTAPLSWNKLKEAFPQAHVFTEYAMIETQASVGVPCRYIREDGEQYFHMIPDASHIELLDEDSLTLRDGEGDVGEITITTLRPSATTLIRYRTGDRGRIVSEQCPCGNGPIFSAEGRLDIDRIRIPTGELNVAELDRVIASLAPRLLSIEYRARYQEGGERPQLFIALDTHNTEMFAEEISRKLHIAPKRSYYEAVCENLFLPLRVERFVADDVPAKRKRLIRVTV